MGSRSKVHGARVALDVVMVLADVGRATRHKIADEIELRTGFRRSPESIRRAINFMYAELLVERDGRAKKPPSQKCGYGPTIWKLHSRLRYVA